MKTSDFLKLIKKYPIFIENEVMIDEAIKELEDLENRSCDNCNFSNIDTYFTDYGKCEKGYGFLFNGRVEVIKDFCCNKWEAKNENL